MDDPWGSPWGVSIDHDEDATTALPAKSGLEPPPPAFIFTTNSPHPPAVSGRSSWVDDEDGFGEWASADGSASAQPGLGGWGGADGNSISRLSPVPKDDAFGRSSPIAWPGTIALPRLSNGSPIRHLSPDPWASEFSHRPSSDGLSTPRLVLEACESPISAVTGTKQTELGEGFGQRDTVNPKKDAQDKKLGSHGSRDGGEGYENDVAATSARWQASGEGEEPAGSLGPTRPSVDSFPRSVVSQQSSLSEADSGHDIERQDSPITSIDDDSKLRIDVGRNPPGRVEELVHKFDGLAAASSGMTPETVRRERSQGPSNLAQPSITGVMEDFGDFEHDEKSSPPTSPVPSDAKTSDAAATGTGEARTAEVPSQSLQKPIAVPSILEQLESKFGTIEFEVDMQNVEALFGAAEDPNMSLGTNTDFSDHVITDSFTEISQRKVWYRVSRQGSSRKHDAGDDENYRRITWQLSALRLDTIKTVRRWMEEDSIHGKVVLGGGAARGNMFGWDSAAEPVALDEVFGKRAERTRSKTVSVREQASTSTYPHGTASAQREIPVARKTSGQRPFSMVERPAASFSWSTGPVEGVAAEMDVPTQPSAPASSIQAEFPVAPTDLTPTSRKIAAAPLPQNEDDDEWGEMVSSPTGAKPMNSLQNQDNGSNSTRTETFDLADFVAPSGPSQKTPNADANHHASSTSTKDPWPTTDISASEFEPSVKQPAPETPGPPNGKLIIASTHPSASCVPSSGSTTGPTSAAWPLTTDNVVTPTPTPTALPAVSPIAVPAVNASTSPQILPSVKSSEAGEILGNLPDLSYMLR